jgi:hypothetical protein
VHWRNSLRLKTKCLSFYIITFKNTVKIRFGRKKILNYACVEKWSRSVSHLFFIFTQSLLNPPFCVVENEIYLKGIQAVRIEFFLIIKVANIRWFILIVVETFNYAYVLKNGVGRYNIFNFYTKLAESSFLCHFRIESSMCLFFHNSICAMCFLHQQTIYISFKLETKIFFSKKNIIKSTQVLSMICNTICLQFSLYWASLQSLGLLLLISVAFLSNQSFVNAMWIFKY